MATMVACAVSGPAVAEQRDQWEVSVTPLYLWAMALDGSLSAGPATVPVFLKFADAADHLDTAFSFHFEAARGRWGVLADLNLIQLSSSSTYTVAGRPIQGEFELDNVVVDVGGSFLLNAPARFRLIGGMRAYAVSAKLAFPGTSTGATPIDTSNTSPNAFVGVDVRPRLTDKWTFLARGDIGGGDADLTWSGLVGFEYRVARWGSVDLGFKALGIDVKSADRLVREYDVTHYGPIAGFRFHWGQ